MNLLAPWYVPLLAMGLTAGPLILLYFLKLKRREVPISSTLLWQQAMQDLQVNSPFQKLRNNLLLILQLLILLAAALAIAEPMRKGHRGVDEAIVLLIDQSGSMATDEGGGRTRLSIAKQEARKVIDDMSTAQRAMVIAFSDRARVLSSFTDDKETLRQAIDAIEQTDASGRLGEAMELAEAHSTPLGEGIGTDPGIEIAESHYMVFTDGRLPDSSDLVVQRGVLEIVRIGRASDNVGIVELDVRRAYEKPEQLSVLARVRNFGPAPANRDVSLLVDGELKSVRTPAALAPLGPADKLKEMDLSGVPPEGNEATVAFDLILGTAARIELRLSGQDAFPTDDRAHAIVAPPRPITVLLVTPGNRYLRHLLSALPLGHYDVWTPKEYEDNPDDKLVEDGRCRYDVVILDGHSTDRLAPGNYIFFAAIPGNQGVQLGSEPLKEEALLDWDETHPILRHISLEAMTVFSWFDLELPAQAATLIEATNGPILALLIRGRNQYLICAFGIFDQDRTHLNTDWVFSEGLPVFMYNALRYLAGSSTTGRHPPVAPGEAFTVAAGPNTQSVTVRRPDGGTETAAVRSSGLVTYGRTDRAGVYTVSTGIPGQDARAVNLLDEGESFIAPNEVFRIATGQAKATQGLDRVNRPFWPYLLAVLGVILFIEWFVYNRRVFV